MGKQKIVFLPLDERPCNYNYPKFLYQDNKDFEFKIIERNKLGHVKQAGDLEAIKDYLLEETKDAYGLVIALDTLCYGGIVPSRLHYFKKEEINKRLDIIKQIKEVNSNLIIFGFYLIMRCPQGSNACEEPDYYDICGREIFLSGFYKHKEMLGLLTDEQKKNYESLNIKKEYLDDFINRRTINTAINLDVIDLVKENLIDFLIVPQDDSAEFGYTAMDQEKVRRKVKELHLETKVLMYPGADEVGLTLLTRMINKINNVMPKYYIRYPSLTSQTLIPCLEDRYLDTSIRYQILASGGLTLSSCQEADMILGAFIGAKRMIPGPNIKRDFNLDIYPNYIEMIEYLNYYKDKMPVGIADMTFLNGADYDLVSLMKEKDMLLSVASYAGWNTAANTLGTVIAQMNNYYLYHNEESNKEFLMLRYFEDLGFQSFIRNDLNQNYLPKMGLNYFDLKDKKEEVILILKQKMEEFKNKIFDDDKKYNYEITKYDFPWNRIFEVELEVKHGKKN